MHFDAESEGRKLWNKAKMKWFEILKLKSNKKGKKQQSQYVEAEAAEASYI